MASDAEPEREPESQASDPTGSAESSSDKLNAKIDIRNIKVNKFDGSVELGAFDSNVRDWWEEFMDQVEDAQTLAGQTWTEKAKLSVLNMHLEGMARRWFRRWRSDNPLARLGEAGHALVAQYRSRLTDPQISQRVSIEKKKWGETYREYADRLLVMTSALEGGNTIAINARHALDAFVRMAWPKHTDNLKVMVRLRSPTPVAELDRAVEAIMELTGADGKMHSERVKAAPRLAPAPLTERALNKGQKFRAQLSPPGRKRVATASVAVVERKRKKLIKQPGKNKFACYVCGDTGHVARFHRQFLSGGDEGKGESGNANQAVEKTRPASDDAENDSSHSGNEE